MPFSLAYRYEAMVLVELGACSLRRDNFDPEQNMILQWCELDFLEEKWCNSQLWVVAYQWRTTQCFNLKVKTRRFQEEDIVHKKFLHNKRALDPSWEGPYKIAEVLTPSAYQLAHLNGDWISRLWNADYLRMYYQWLHAPLSIKFTI